MFACAQRLTRHAVLLVLLQYLGDADVVQELEDFGQLDTALAGELVQ
jgi:hypothetical protein